MMIELVAVILTALWIVSVIAALFWPGPVKVTFAVIMSAVYFFILLYPIVIRPTVLQVWAWFVS